MPSGVVIITGQMMSSWLKLSINSDIDPVEVRQSLVGLVLGLWYLTLLSTIF
jgi:hypothetical protein